MPFFRRFERPASEPKPALIERPPLTDAEIDALLDDPAFVAEFIEWRERQR